MEIFEQFGLQVEQLEENVYGVLNTDLIVNVTRLQQALGDCLIVRSSEIKLAAHITGDYAEYEARVFYVILDYEATTLLTKYAQIAVGEFGAAGISVHKQEEDSFTVGAIYSEEEMLYEGYLKR